MSMERWKRKVPYFITTGTCRSTATVCKPCLLSAVPGIHWLSPLRELQKPFCCILLKGGRSLDCSEPNLHTRAQAKPEVLDSGFKGNWNVQTEVGCSYSLSHFLCLGDRGGLLTGCVPHFVPSWQEGALGDLCYTWPGKFRKASSPSQTQTCASAP